jgi:uncharacterized membrane protein
VASERPGWSDQQVEVTIAHVLRGGLMVAAAVVVMGGLVYLLHHGGDVPSYRIFRGEPADLRSIRGILGDSLTLRGTGVIQLGLLLLLATPVARVAFSVIAFALQRDRFYVAVTLVVLAVLLYSIIGQH